MKRVPAVLSGIFFFDFVTAGAASGRNWRLFMYMGVVKLESNLSVPLGEQVHLKEFFDMMQKSGREEAAEDVEHLITCVEEMQEDLSEAMEEIKFLKQQIKEMQDATMKAKLQKTQEEMMNSVKMARQRLDGVKQDIAGQVRNAAAACKKKGIQTLDHILDAAHIYDGLSSVEQHLNHAVAAMERRIEKVDRMADELHEVKGHVKNIGNVAAGRPVAVPAGRDRSKGILAKIENSMRYCKKLIAGMEPKLLVAKAHVVHLQKEAERKGEEKTASVQEILKELRESSNMALAAQNRTLESRS